MAPPIGDDSFSHSITSTSYFDAEGEQHELELAGSLDEPLTWRGDPLETYSDWTIVVVTSELETRSFHVHRSVLCFGSRQSRYFAKVMLNHEQELKKNRRKQHPSQKHKRKPIEEAVPTTKVELNQTDADNFPLLLDFIYAPAEKMATNDTVLTAASTVTSLSLHLADTEDTADTVGYDVITTKNALSLRYLAKRFEVDSFMRAVNKFIQHDLNFETGPQYLTKGWEYKDERIIASAQRLCAENFEQLDVRALSKLPYNVFRIIVRSLESYEEENRELSLFLSNVVCRYLQKNQEGVDAASLLELTDPILMPYIGAEAAIGFTTHVKGLESDDAGQHWDGLVALCRRCAKTVVQEYGWSDFSVNAAVDEYLGNTKNGKKQVSRVDSLLFATSYAAALEQAQDDYEEITVEQDNLEMTIDALQDSISLMERMNGLKDQHMSKQQQAIEQAKGQIQMLKQQINEVREQQQRRYNLMQPPPPPPPPPLPPAVAPIPPPPPVAASKRVANILNDLEKIRPLVQNQPKGRMTTEEIVRDLVSPSQVEGRILHHHKDRNAPGYSRELMRSKSILSRDETLDTEGDC